MVYVNLYNQREGYPRPHGIIHKEDCHHAQRRKGGGWRTAASNPAAHADTRFSDYDLYNCKDNWPCCGPHFPDETRG